MFVFSPCLYIVYFFKKLNSQQSYKLTLIRYGYVIGTIFQNCTNIEKLNIFIIVNHTYFLRNVVLIESWCNRCMNAVTAQCPHYCYDHKLYIIKLCFFSYLLMEDQCSMQNFLFSLNVD